MAPRKITWKFLLSRRWTILRCELFTKGYVKPLERYIGVPNRDLLVTSEFSKGSLYNSVKSLREISEALISKLREDKDFGKKIYKDCVAACENLVDVSKKVSQGNLSSLDNAELVKRLDSYIDAANTFTPFLALPNNYELFITGKLKDFLSGKVGEEKVEEYLQKLMTPKEYPFQVLEQVDLAQIVLKVKSKKLTNLSKELARHKQKYQWLSCYNFDEKEFSLEDFKERLEVLLELPLEELRGKTEGIVNQLEKDELEFQRTAEEIGLSGDLLDQVKLLREFVFLRTYRIEMNSQSNFYLKPLLKEISRRGGVSVRELAMMLVSEIEAMLKEGKIPKSVNFAERERAAVLWLDSCQFNCTFGDQAKKIISEKLGGGKVIEQVGEIKGTTASKGKVVRGKARVVSKENISSFQRGEILVTTMTSPEFMPAIQKAVAIVTDEGGVLCHAAIVSRELNKPCVIGTEVATKVLKTGDMVEVDAEKGVVKKLEKGDLK